MKTTLVFVGGVAAGFEDVVNVTGGYPSVVAAGGFALEEGGVGSEVAA